MPDEQKLRQKVTVLGAAGASRASTTWGWLNKNTKHERMLAGDENVLKSGEERARDDRRKTS